MPWGSGQRRNNCRGKPERRLFVVFFLIFGSLIVSAAAQPSPAPRYGVVDYRVLLSCHPLMARFNPMTHRFNDSPSMPVGNPEDARKDVQTKQKEARARIQQLDEGIKSVVAKGGAGVQEAYAQHWKKRQILNDEVEALEKTEQFVAVQGNYVEGVPPAEAMIPTLQIVNRGVGRILSDLQKRYGLVAVLDSSVLLQGESNEDVSLDPPMNVHWNLWGGGTLSQEDIQRWRHLVRGTYAALLPAGRRGPFKAGFIDLTAEAAGMIRRLTGGE
ncbi:MAG: hypothetical protein WA705_30720 [Candidatus Ozemobacteraceae bacterium]